MVSSAADVPNPDPFEEVVGYKAISSENIPTPESNQETLGPSGKSESAKTRQ